MLVGQSTGWIPAGLNHQVVSWLRIFFFVTTINKMKITYDPNKRNKTLQERGLDFEDAAVVFAGRTLTRIDNREEYGEERITTIGHLHGRMVIICWTHRDGTRRVFSMRKANDREQKKFGQRLGQS
uniref:BrnT family toxin n=1 Tax=Magnetococcus massalia (strain MO-1) TaxID=451514 RepID=A0A1S7LIT8_MAGMO|nr:Protein of unknown function [Candidatus Magnetococcus massalia]